MEEKNNYQEQAEKLNRAEITDCKECIEITKRIIDRAVLLAREITYKLCSRDFDSNDRRIIEACAAERHIEDAIESLALIIGYDTATIAIDRANTEED